MLTENLYFFKHNNALCVLYTLVYSHPAGYFFSFFFAGLRFTLDHRKKTNSCPLLFTLNLWIRIQYFMLEVFIPSTFKKIKSLSLDSKE